MTTTNLSAVADPLRLYDETFASRLLLGTARYPSPQSLEDAVRVSNPAMLTVALRRQSAGSPEGGAGFWKMLRELGVPVLPNTAGCYSADEAYTLAQMSREV
ncbi:MAG: thiazole synthase, partial [Pseudomonadota bacterium]|nr:thiazole synthase [Pseudomonadota bacterium]